MNQQRHEHVRHPLAVLVQEDQLERVCRPELQRRLADADSSFSATVDELRFAFAKMHLQRGDLSNQEVAFVLGFAETSAFYRAFRRWSGGVTPGDWRRATQH